jgi:hypothetical protein
MPSDKPGRKMYNSGDFDEYEILTPPKMKSLDTLHRELIALNEKILTFRNEMKMKDYRSAASLQLTRKALAKANKEKKQLIIKIESHPDFNLPSIKGYGKQYLDTLR